MAQKNKSLELIVSQLLTKQNKTIAIAESCTGGLISHRLTNIPGSSRYFKLSLIAYTPTAKTFLLKIPKEKIKRFGSVSKETAILMARGVKKLAGTTIGLGITGIAGPTGGNKFKPVGLVYIALVLEDKEVCKEFHFAGNRLAIKRKASEAALSMLKLLLVEIRSRPSFLEQ
jgi:nicotinamide-nucleotide amidase